MRRLYQINPHVWLREQDWFRPEEPDLAALPDEQAQEWAALGFDAVWFLGVWKKGEATRRICRESEHLRDNFGNVLPDLTDDDIVGSPFSIADYSVDPSLGNDTTLERLRTTLNRHGLKLILDFVPNHMAVDHPWVAEHPERFVQGSETMIEKEPANYFRVPSDESRILAHGRDPYFAGWSDTVQINIFSREARAALLGELQRVAAQCDAVRCDMAMLIANEVFRHTWGDLWALDYEEPPEEFWIEATRAVRERHPDFRFIAEVYWGLERSLQQMGFDLTYDKTLYDHLRGGNGSGAREHLAHTDDIRERQLRFVENHDEPRAADAFGRRQGAAAAVTGALPGVWMCHEGELGGRRVHVPVQLARRPDEHLDAALRKEYARLFEALAEPVFVSGELQHPWVGEAWFGNPSHNAIVAFWRHAENEHRLVAANLSGDRAQAYVEVPHDGMDWPVLEFADRTSDAAYYRSREELNEHGLYLDLDGGQYHIFRVDAAAPGVEPHSESQ